jgi:chromosomal replication initiation ATPase DnaA
MTPLPTIASIKQAVAAHYNLPLEAMTRRCRLWEEVHPRQVAMCLSRRLTEHSSPTIGRLFQRDHSTVLTGVAAAERRCRNNPEVASAMRRLTLELVRR